MTSTWSWTAIFWRRRPKTKQPDKLYVQPAQRKAMRDARQTRRDASRRRVLRAAAAEKHLLLDAAECVPTYDHPALVVWPSGDRGMPPELGRRLTELLPQARLVEVPVSYTLIPLHQAARLAQAIRDFTQSSNAV